MEDELEPGQSSLVRTLTQKDIELFAVTSGDVNPAHISEEFAKSDTFGMWGGTLISTVLDSSFRASQTLPCKRPVASGVAEDKDPENHRVAFDCICLNQKANW